MQAQHQKDADINNIVKKYQATGQLPGMIKTNPVWGDFSSPMDFREAHDLMIKANEQFEALPSKVRERFSNDPGNFLEFATNPANLDEMESMGLLNEKALEARKNARAARKKEGEASPQPAGDKK